MEDKRIPINRIDYIPKELESLVTPSKAGTKKICVVVHPDENYVPYIQHIISNIGEVMDHYFEVKTLPDDVKPQESNFQTILKLLKDCVLGIVILDGLRPNVVLEYGILLGLGKPIIVLKDSNAEIDIENLNDKLKSQFEKRKISNPKLDIDKHLSDVKDLHWTRYNWGNPNELKEIMEENLKSLKDDIISEAKKSLSTPEINNLSTGDYKELQQAFSELVKYAIRFVIPDYKKVKAIDKNIHQLVSKSNVKLPSNYYFELGNIYEELLKHDEALSSFDEAIKINPNDALAWYVKAGVYVLKGDKKNTFKNLSKAIELDAKFKEDAKKDEPFFKNLWNDEGFKRIVN